MNNLTTKSAIFVVTAMLVASCSDPKTNNVKNPYYTSTAPSDSLTPEAMWQFGRVGNVVLSPNKKNIAFTIAFTNIAENASYTDIYTLPTDGGKPQCITSTKENEDQISWTPDGRIAYLAPNNGETQVWTIDPDGSAPTQITNIEGGIEAYQFSPDGQKLLVVKRVRLDQTIADRYPDLPKANARIETDIMYRHWNQWADGTYNHILVVPLAEGKQNGAPTDIMEGERYHSPLMPMGDIRQISWTPDSRSIAYTCKKKTGKEAAFSTNSDIYLYDTQTQQTTNLTEANLGYDINPHFTPDGRYMLWQSMERDGYESDKNRLMLMNIATKEKFDLSANTENNIDYFTLSDDGQSVWAIIDDKAKDQIFRISLENGTISQLTTDTCNYTSVVDAGSFLIAERMSMSAPNEIYKIDKQSGKAVCLSNINTKALSSMEMGNVEERWITTTDGKQMLVWVIYPPHFDANKKYPALLFCQGGPQSTVSQFWSLRWNFQLMAANGYIVVAPNRRGLPGFGREWNEQISGDYGGQNMKDYLSAIDNIAAEEYVDANRLGAVGASYGGYSVYWLAGHHQKRFKAFIAHCGIFNMEQMYATTDEEFFVDWEFKGAPWDTNNAAAQASYANSPHLFVNKWDTPIMVIHGEKDFRIPYIQGLEAFNTAVIKGIEAEFLYFPDECHWVQKPQNSILWHREFFRWLDKHLK